MKRILPSLTLALLGALGLQAQTSTTITVNASVSLINFAVSGTAALTGIGSGPITATLTAGGSGLSGPFTIALSGGNITGTVNVPTTVLTGTGSISLTVTGGTGSYAGATGSFPKLDGSAALGATGSVTLTNYTGAGTITLGSGGGGTSTSPVITDVLDAGGYTKNIAQGSIFVIKGRNLSADGFTQFSFPLPATSAGIRITFTPTGGGAGTDAYLIYLYNQGGVNQLAAVLPSTVAAGNYNVTVTNGSATSAVFATQVVRRKPGLITADSTGSGLAVIQNFISAAQLDLNRFTTGTLSSYTISPAKPGQVLIAWMTGMGGVTTPDNAASPGFDFAGSGVTVDVIVGSSHIKPLYAGRTPGLAGTDQINFILPADVTTGCTVPFQVSVDGILSNPAFVAIAPSASATECVAPGYTAAQLKNFDQGGSITLGAFSLSQITQTVPQLGTVKINAAGGIFTKITGFQLAAGAAQNQQTQPPQNGACQVIHVVGRQDQVTNPVAAATGLDAGNITLSGPAGSNLTNLALTKDATTKSYGASLGFEPNLIPNQPSYPLVAGQYTLRGAGGPDVGAFTANVTLGSPLVIAGGLPTVVTRANGLPLTWTGGNASDPVQIVGYAGTTSGTGTNVTVDATEFICTTTAGAGSFTVPASILTQLPAVTAAQITGGTGTGYLLVTSSGNLVSGNGLFTAPLTAGGNIDTGVFIGSIGIGATPAYQ